MAINFTDSPSDGATITANGKTYTYESSSAKWKASAAASGGGGSVTTYANIAALPSSGNTGGDLAFVTDVKAFYGWDGTEWDRVFSGKNMLPEFTTSPAASYDLADDGTATTVTIAATDPEGFAVSYSHDTSPTNQAQATITQSGGTFTVTPSTTTSNAGTFTARFKAFDGVRTNSASSTFSLEFSNANAIYANTYLKYQAAGGSNSWTTTNLSAAGNTSMYLAAATFGNMAITSDPVTVSSSLHGTGALKRYFEYVVEPNQIWINAGWRISTAAGTNSGGFTANNSPASGNYSANWQSSTGTNIITAMIDPNVSKCHFWRNGVYVASESVVMTAGTYYATVADGSSSNYSTAGYASIFKGRNSVGSATNFTYNPMTLWNALTTAQQGG